MCFLSDAAEQGLLIDSAYWAAAAVGGERLISTLVSAKKNKKMYACAVCYCSSFLLKQTLLAYCYFMFHMCV